MELDEETQKGLDLQRSIAYDIMGTALNRGLPILDTLRVGAYSVNDSRLELAFLSMRESIRQGDSIANSMRKTGFNFYDFEYQEMDEGEVHAEVDVRLHSLAERLDPYK